MLQGAHLAAQIAVEQNASASTLWRGFSMPLATLATLAAVCASDVPTPKAFDVWAPISGPLPEALTARPTRTRVLIQPDAFLCAFRFYVAVLRLVHGPATL